MTEPINLRDESIFIVIKFGRAENDGEADDCTDYLSDYYIAEITQADLHEILAFLEHDSKGDRRIKVCAAHRSKHQHQYKKGADKTTHAVVGLSRPVQHYGHQSRSDHLIRANKKFVL